MAKAKKKVSTKTPYEKGTYCIYVPNRRVIGYKNVESYFRPGHHLCQVRTSNGGEIVRVKNKACNCVVKAGVTKSGRVSAKGSRKKTKK